MTDGTARRHRVLFLPDGTLGEFHEGSTVLQAARVLGQDLDTVCGGRALCGHCLVVVTEGADQLSAVGPEEQQFLAARGAAASSRLACRARVCGDVTVEVPPRSRLHRQLIRKPCEAHEIDVRPIVRPYFVSVDAAARGDPHGDLERLCMALSREWGIDVEEWDPRTVSNLQDALREGNWNVTAAIRADRELVAVWPGLQDRLYGVAIDVGSTTLAAQLCELSSGELLAEAGCINPQVRFGEDLMSRVSYVMKNADGREELTDAVRGAINGLIADLAGQAGCPIEDIVELVAVGNSVMHHLLLGWNPSELGRAPFTLVSSSAVDVRARDVGIRIHPAGHVYVLPCIAGHIGADMAGVLLAEAPWEMEEISLVIDVGTNAELALGNSERLLVASSPTGPAFEGAHTSAGQRAARGAIERVRVDAVTLEPRYRVIGSDLWSDEAGFQDSLSHGGVTGICGSGIIEAIAELYRVGIIASDGRILGDMAARSARIVQNGTTFAYVLVDGSPGVRVEQGDVRAIQLAKAALHAGARLLMEKLGVSRVDRIRLAGAFGAQIDVRYAMTLGMIPDCPLDRVSSAGNAAGTGARIALLDRNARGMVQRRVREVERIETAIEPRFHEHFVDALAIPHQTHPYDELRKVVTLPAPAPKRTAAGRSA